MALAEEFDRLEMDVEELDTAEERADVLERDVRDCEEREEALDWELREEREETLFKDDAEELREEAETLVREEDALLRREEDDREDTDDRSDEEIVDESADRDDELPEDALLTNGTQGTISNLHWFWSLHPCCTFTYGPVLLSRAHWLKSVGGHVCASHNHWLMALDASGAALLLDCDARDTLPNDRMAMEDAADMSENATLETEDRRKKQSTPFMHS